MRPVSIVLIGIKLRRALPILMPLGHAVSAIGAFFLHVMQTTYDLTLFFPAIVRDRIFTAKEFM